jgi:acyl-CoA thioesterase-1
MLAAVTPSVAAADELVIAALGDSLTAGYGLATDQGLVPQLDRWLAAQGVSVDLRNAGVSGDTTSGGLSRVDWTLTPDVDAMIVALGGNDYLRGLDPTLSRENLMGILEVAAAKDVPVMLVGLRVGSNYGPDYKAAFEGMYAELAEAYSAPLYPAFFDGMRAATNGGPLTPYLQADGIHPSAEGVRLIVNDFGPAVLDFAKSLGD